MRFLQYIPLLEAGGVEVCVSPLLSDEYLKTYYAGRSAHWMGLFIVYLRRMLVLLKVRKYELIWIEKELFPNFPAWFEMLLIRFGVAYVVDYDDAIFHNYDLSVNPLKKLMSRKIDKVMRASDLVVCGNAYLAERASQAGARRVEVLPTVIDLQRYTVSHTDDRKTIVLGWVGSPATVKYLEGISSVLQRLSAKFSIRLCVIGAEFFAEGLDVECRPWTEENEVTDIQDFDIGIMPLHDSPWERGKCGYKLIQYMACGLPCVASPVGVNETIIKNGINGYLASNMEEWFETLNLLCVDTEARRSMGDQGRQMVEQTYCIQVTAPRLARLFAEVVAAEVV